MLYALRLIIGVRVLGDCLRFVVALALLIFLIDDADQIESLMHHTLERLGVTLIQLSHCDPQNNYSARWTVADLKAAKQALALIANARQFLDDGKCAAALSTIWIAERMM